MKSLIIIVVLGVIGIGCSTTTYLSLTENDEKRIQQELSAYEKGNSVGAEVSIVLFNGKEIDGELLSVRDSTVILCTEYAAAEEELANLVYPVIIIKDNEIQEFTLEGSSYVWTGIGAGTLAGAITLGLAVEELKYTSTLIFPLCIVAGGITGYILSKEEFILYDIPPGYSFYFLNELARYKEVEPAYLKAID